MTLSPCMSKAHPGATIPDLFENRETSKIFIAVHTDIWPDGLLPLTEFDRVLNDPTRRRQGPLYSISGKHIGFLLIELEKPPEAAAKLPSLKALNERQTILLVRATAEYLSELQELLIEESAIHAHLRIMETSVRFFQMHLWKEIQRKLAVMSQNYRFILEPYR